MKRKIKWGIIGLGKIANTFAHDILLSENARLCAVASRSPEKAQKFAAKYNVEKHYGSYYELAKDPDIDVIYIATPHSYHYENTLLCLENGKSVLCEKPMGMNAQQVEMMIKTAMENKLFLMEGIWTRFMPATEKLLELLNKKVIGEIKEVRADFGFQTQFNPDSRLYNKSLGGGSLLDIGIYPIYLSLITLGIPTGITATAEMTKTMVDASCSIDLTYKNSARAYLESSILKDTKTEALIRGEKGYIKLHTRFHQSQMLSLTIDGICTDYKLPYPGNGYLNEIKEVNSCLLQGKNQSPKLPLKLSLELITIIDNVRRKIGLKYNSD